MMEIGEKMESQSTKENFKKPKRIIHFGDGEVVEYSTDEDECPESATSKCVLQIDPVSSHFKCFSTRLLIPMICVVYAIT